MVSVVPEDLILPPEPPPGSHHLHSVLDVAPPHLPDAGHVEVVQGVDNPTDPCGSVDWYLQEGKWWIKFPWCSSSSCDAVILRHPDFMSVTVSCRKIKSFTKTFSQSHIWIKTGWVFYHVVSYCILNCLQTVLLCVARCRQSLSVSLIYTLKSFNSFLS